MISIDITHRKPEPPHEDVNEYKAMDGPSGIIFYTDFEYNPPTDEALATVKVQPKRPVEYVNVTINVNESW